MKAKRIVLAATLLVFGLLVALGSFGSFGASGDLAGVRAAQAQEIFECSDGIDNDGDLLVDYPADPDCLAPDGVSESRPSDMNAGATDAGVVDMRQFSKPDGDVSGTPGPDPGAGGPTQPAREDGCAIAVAGPMSVGSLSVGMMLVGLMLGRHVRRRT